MKLASETLNLFEAKHQFDWHWSMVKHKLTPLLIMVTVAIFFLFLAVGNGGAVWVLFALCALWLLISLSELHAHLMAMRYTWNQMKELEATMAVRDVMGS